MKGKPFDTIEEIKEKSKQVLLAMPKSAFQECFEDYEDASISVLYLRGGYFERNKIVIDK